MSNYVNDNLDLANHPKTDGAGDATGKWDAVDANNVRNAINDIKGAIRGGKFFGLTPQASDPAPSGIPDYLWLGTDGVLHMVTPSGSVVVATAFSTNKLIVIAGQSNATGRDKSSNITTDTADVTPYLTVTEAQQFALGASDPIPWVTSYLAGSLQPRTPADANTNDMGSELSMMRYLDSVQPGGWKVAKFSVDSSGLDAHWKPSSTYPTSPAGGPNLLAQFISFVAAQQSALSAKVGCIVWIQGETDAQTSGPAAAYQANLTAMVASIRAAYPNVPFVLVQLSTQTTYTYTGTVRTAQANFVGATPHTALVDCSDLALQGDVTHYTADGLIAMGKRVGVAVLQQLAIPVPPVASYTKSVTNRTATFTDTSTTPVGTVTTWAWDFGDGATSAVQSPVHTYAGNGSFTVSLTVTNSGGQMNTYTAPVGVNNVAWTVDDINYTRGFPKNATEWSAVMTAAGIGSGGPSLLYLPGAVRSGNVPDAIGTFTGTVTGTVARQQSVPGYATKAMGFTNGVAGMIANTDAGLPDLSATSGLLLSVVSLPATNSASHGVIAMGANGTAEWAVLKSDNTFSEYHDVTGFTTGASDASNAVRPVTLQFDKTNSHCVLYTNQEKISGAFHAEAGKATYIGGNNVATLLPPAMGVMMVAEFTGAAAELTQAQVKTLHQTLGWTIPY